MSVPYIKYENLEEFYTIKEVCSLFRIEKKELKEKCTKYESGDLSSMMFESCTSCSIMRRTEDGT